MVMITDNDALNREPADLKQVPVKDLVELREAMETQVDTLREIAQESKDLSNVLGVLVRSVDKKFSLLDVEIAGFKSRIFELEGKVDGPQMRVPHRAD